MEENTQIRPQDLLAYKKSYDKYVHSYSSNRRNLLHTIYFRFVLGNTYTIVRSFNMENNTQISPQDLLAYNICRAKKSYELMNECEVSQ